MPRGGRRITVPKEETPSSEKQMDLVKSWHFSMAELKAAWVVLENWNKLQTIDYYISASRKLERFWKRWVDSYVKYNSDLPEKYIRDAFTRDWKALRLRLPLQDRLVVEQVLYDKGGWHRKLVSGFRPIGATS